MTLLDDRMKQYKPLGPADLVFRSAPDDRTAENAEVVLAQFDVGHALRYQPRDNLTFCNIFCWDVATAFGVGLPHWVTQDGAPAHPGPHAHETTANELRDRLVGGAWGWKPLEEVQAAASAARGRPTIAVWRNHSGPGHIAWLEPTSDVDDVMVAQAGSICGRHMPLASAFGRQRVRQVLFFGNA
jgi:hypothetical protein